MTEEITKNFAAALDRLRCKIEPGQNLDCSEQELNDEAGQPDNKTVADWWKDRLKEAPTGWAQFSDRNVWVTSGVLSEAPLGILLAAELCADEGSHHLRQTATGWVATTITKKSDPNAFLETRTLLHSKDSPGELTYEVAWIPDASGALRPTAFRLVKP